MNDPSQPPPLKAWLVKCPACGGTGRRCNTCGRKGYIVIDKSGLNEPKAPEPVPAPAPVPEPAEAALPRRKHDWRSDTRMARILNGKCAECGEEELETRTLGARCRDLRNEARRNSL